MSKKEFMEAMGHVDDRILARYMKEEARLSANTAKRKIWIRWTAAAACFALIAALTPVMILLNASDNPPLIHTTGNLETPTKPTIPTPPIYLDAEYTAQEIADLFPKVLSSGTNAYTKVYTDKPENLTYCPVSDWGTLPLYQYQQPNTPLDKSEFTAFLNPMLPKLASALGTEIPDYTIDAADSDTPYWSMDISIDQYRFNAVQNTAFTSVIINTRRTSDGSRTILLDKQPLQIDPTQSDEAILASLVDVQEKLMDIFGVSFSDARISRHFRDSSEHGEASIYVHFYNSDDHPLNTFIEGSNTLYSDYISIQFDHYVSDDLLTGTSIRYLQNRTDLDWKYQQKGQAKQIPLEEAEALLYNGYVFGGHSCPLCMAAQDLVNFQGYDYVGLEYVFGQDYLTGIYTQGVPFYTFYQQIGTAENDNLIYAKTYVPAIEVSGYKEFFEGQQDQHN